MRRDLNAILLLACLMVAAVAAAQGIELPFADVAGLPR